MNATPDDHPADRHADADRAELPPRRNILLTIAYDGGAYHGWQRQIAGVDTVQERVERAAARVLGHPVTVFGAGRTDAGVHAAGQTANFYTPNPHIPVRNIRRALNAGLPRDIAILSARTVPEGFHASRSAVGKTYRYRIFTAPLQTPEQARVSYHYPWNVLDLDRMREAGRRLLGRHDFRGLASSAEQRRNTVRTITRCDLAEIGPEIHVHVEGDGFLYNMVRNIVGTLVEIGRGKRPVELIERILATCDRADAGFTAQPQGLTLLSVHYLFN